MLRQFTGYLTGPDGMKENKIAMQHARQVYSIWLDIKTQDKFNPSDFLQIDNFKKNWLEKSQKVFSHYDRN